MSEYKIKSLSLAIKKLGSESSSDCRSDEGIAIQMIDSLIGVARVLRRNYNDMLSKEDVYEALKDLASDEDIEWILEKAKDSIEKEASISTTQLRYIDSSGKEFSAQEIVQGYRPKGPYKVHSLADRVNSKEFGKVKK